MDIYFDQFCFTLVRTALTVRAVARFCKIKARVRDDSIIRAFQLIGESVQFPVFLMFLAQLELFLRPLRPGTVFNFGK